MYHIPGITPEADSIEELAFGGRKVKGTFPLTAPRSGAETYEKLQARARPRKRSISSCSAVRTILPPSTQMALIAHMLENKKIHSNVQLWVHTPRVPESSQVA